MSKQEFLSEMQAKLKEFDAKMSQLSARPKPKSEHARLEREKTYYFLKAKRDEIRDQMKLAEKATEEAAGAFKTSMGRDRCGRAWGRGRWDRGCAYVRRCSATRRPNA